MFKRLLCSRIDCPDASQPRGTGSLFAAPLLHRIALGCSLPLIGFLSSQLAGDEFKTIPQPASAESVFQVVQDGRGQVESIRTTPPDSGVRLLSFQEELPSPIQRKNSRQTTHSTGKVKLIRRGQQRRAALKPLPRLDDMVESSHRTENVEELVEDITPREQFLKELRRSVNPVQEVPLPEPVPGAADDPEMPMPAELPVQTSPVELTPVPKPVPLAASESLPEQTIVPERKIVEVIRVKSEPRWMVMNRQPAFSQRVLGQDEVKKLLTRSRMELAAGDLELAHMFAEAASEVTIPRELFDKKPELILTEIEYVTARDDAIVSVDYNSFQEGGTPEPDSPTQLLKDDPKGFRAIGPKSLSIRPLSVNREGAMQRIPEAETRERLIDFPEIVHSKGFGRGWGASSYSWAAPALYHSPLYYEEVELERYGNEICIAQPVVSGVRFYLTPFTLPYQMGIEDYSVLSCQYDLGHDRPGACVPYSIHALPFSWTGAVAEAGFATGLAFLIP
ncbi:MAG: hypothetical protein VB858_06530 [Planctomycetaceae bacterium]